MVRSESEDEGASDDCSEESESEDEREGGGHDAAREREAILDIGESEAGRRSVDPRSRSFLPSAFWYLVDEGPSSLYKLARQPSAKLAQVLQIHPAPAAPLKVPHHLRLRPLRQTSKNLLDQLSMSPKTRFHAAFMFLR